MHNKHLISSYSTSSISNYTTVKKKVKKFYFNLIYHRGRNLFIFSLTFFTKFFFTIICRNHVIKRDLVNWFAYFTTLYWCEIYMRFSWIDTKRKYQHSFHIRSLVRPCSSLMIHVSHHHQPPSTPHTTKIRITTVDTDFIHKKVEFNINTAAHTHALYKIFSIMLIAILDCL